jgi:uridylate kinase
VATPKYRRVIVKLSGEALSGPEKFGIHQPTIDRFAADLIAAHQLGIGLGVVVGGGNVLRGAQISADGLSRTTADVMGMLATVMNALALQDALEQQGMQARVMSAIRINEVCEDFIRRRAVRHLEKGRAVIFAAGTGNPFFTTDTAAALRATEMHCNALLKGTQVDGVYSADPRKVDNATRYDQLTYLDVLSNDLGVMDAAAISLARENHLPIIVFNIHAPGAFAQVMRGEGAFTRIVESEH